MDTVDNAITKPVHRLEVFTGAGRRRTWSDQDKARIVTEIAVSGESVSAVARRHGLSPQQLFGWRRQLQTPRLRFRKLTGCSSFRQSWMWHRLLRPSGVNGISRGVRLTPVRE